MFGMLRAARANVGSSSAPSMMSALFEAKLGELSFQRAVLPSADVALSITRISPALAFEERA